jgi:hypothetical protein
MRIATSLRRASRSRSLRRSLAAVLALLLAGVLAGATAAQAGVTMVRRSSTVRAGDSVRYVARVAHADACVLTLRRPHTKRIASRATFAGESTITWGWTVPPRAGSSIWRAAIACEPSPSSSAADQPQAQTPSMRLRVIGSKAARPTLIGRSGIAVTVQRVVSAPTKATDRAQLIVSAAGLLGAVIGLILVFRQLRMTRQEGIADRTSQLLDRYQRLEFTELWSRVGPGFLLASDAQECFVRLRVFEGAKYSVSHLEVKEIEGPAEKQTPAHRPGTYGEVMYAANFHEDIAVLFNTAVVSDEQLVRHFGAVIVNHFLTTWWWIVWQRRNGRAPDRYGNGRVLRFGRRGPYWAIQGLGAHETDAFEEWERMVLKIVSERQDLRPDPDAALDGVVWIVCAPTDTEQTDSYWERYAAVSDRLSCPVAALPALEAQLGISGPATKQPPRTRRILCVMRWPEHRAYGDRLRRVAGELDALTIEALEALATRLAPGQS